MTDQSFGTDMRHRLCVQCSESFVVPVTGGDVTCPACSTSVTLKPRSSEPLAEPDAFEETTEQWQKRLAILRRQAENYNRDNKYTFLTAPEGLESLRTNQTVDGLLAALRDQVGRIEERGTSSAPAERAVFWLACQLRGLMSVATEPQRIAAVMHTALDVINDRGFRHALQTRLARIAVSHEDFDAAESWLDLCDPVSTILDLDSDYRITRAMACGGRGDWTRVLDLVGDNEWAVPYEPASVALIGSLRVAALEELGRGFEAEETIKKVISMSPGAKPRDLYHKIFSSYALFDAANRAWKRSEPEQFGVVGEGGGDDIDFVPGASPNVGFAVGALTSFLLGLGLMGLGFYFLGQYRKEHSYKSTQGTLVDVSSKSVGSGKKAKIRVYVQYRFKVGDQVHQGTLIETGQSYYSYSSDRSAAQKIAELKRQKSLPVYYDPKKPDRAILERQNAALHMVPFVITGIVWVVALFLLRVFFVKRREYKKIVEAAEKAEAEADAAQGSGGA